MKCLAVGWVGGSLGRWVGSLVVWFGVRVVCQLLNRGPSLMSHTDGIGLLTCWLCRELVTGGFV